MEVIFQLGEVLSQVGREFRWLIGRNRTQILATPGIHFVQKGAEILGDIGEVLLLKVHVLRASLVDHNLDNSLF